MKKLLILMIVGVVLLGPSGCTFWNCLWHGGPPQPCQQLVTCAALHDPRPEHVLRRMLRWVRRRMPGGMPGRMPRRMPGAAPAVVGPRRLCRRYPAPNLPAVINTGRKLT